MNASSAWFYWALLSAVFAALAAIWSYKWSDARVMSLAVGPRQSPQGGTASGLPLPRERSELFHLFGWA